MLSLYLLMWTTFDFEEVGHKKEVHKQIVWQMKSKRSCMPPSLHQAEGRKEKHSEDNRQVEIFP